MGGDNTQRNKLHELLERDESFEKNKKGRGKVVLKCKGLFAILNRVKKGGFIEKVTWAKIG